MPGEMPGPGSPHGIYVYSGGSWRLLRSEGEAFRLGELGDGVYLVYFDNTLCPACREQDLHMVEIVKRFGGDERIKLVIVLCDWFTQICDSPAAAETIKNLDVVASPTIVVAAVKGGRIVYREEFQGARPAGVLEIYLKRALDSLEDPDG